MKKKKLNYKFFIKNVVILFKLLSNFILYLKKLFFKKE
jgi:hypothetical protein